MTEQLTPGTTLGPYVLGDRLGLGSFAEVWKAVEHSQLGFKTLVALKILRPEKRSPEDVEALIAEATRSAELSHPNVVEVRRIEQHGELVVLVMELVEGGNLADLLQRASAQELRIPRSVVLDIGIDISRALHHAWTGTRADGSSFRIVHRDLKPANVMLARTGEAKVADFGVAKVAGEATATATGVLRGTPAYTPPEVWKGERDFGPATDLFSLGCILFELVMQRRLFDKETVPGLFGQIALGDPHKEMAPLHGRFPGLAELLEELLRREIDDRIQAAEELVERLEELREREVGGEVATFTRALEWLQARDDAGEPPRVPELDDPDWRALRERVDRAEATADPTAVLEPRPAPPNRLTEPAPPAPRSRAMRGLLYLALGVVVLLLADLLLIRVVLEPRGGEAGGAGEEPGWDGLVIEDLPVRTPPPSKNRPAPSPTPRSERTPTPRPTVQVQSEMPVLIPEPVATPRATPRPTPRPTSTPEPTAARTTACLGLKGKPVGSKVWINGDDGLVRRAGSSKPQATNLSPGVFDVGMGPPTAAEPSATLRVYLRGGDAVVVICDVQTKDAARCWKEAGEFGMCD